MNSIDDYTNSGKDGKKSTWHLLFNLPTHQEAIALTIQNRKVVKEILLKDFDSSYQKEITRDQLNLNGSEAVKLAIFDFALEEGDGHSVMFSGYHFKVIEDNGIQFLTVVGTINSKMAEIHYDANSGEYLGWTESH